jgi:type I restriction enzyme, S subunit
MAFPWEAKWETVPLGSLAEFKNGLNYSKKNFGKGMKVINVKDFKDYTFAKLDDLDEINPKGIVREKDLLQEGDILFVRSNGNRELIGRSVFVAGLKERISHSAFTIRGRFVSQKAHPRFYAYLFRTPFIRQTFSSYGGGTNISNLNQQILNALQVPLPPLETQRNIASIISAYDDLIENNTRRIKTLEEMARMIYREWFVNFRFPGHEKVNMVDSPLGMIPEGWEVKTFEDVALNFDRLRKPLSSMQRESRKGPYPYYGAAKVFDYIDDYIFDGEYLLVAEDGSVITPDRKPVLQMTSGKFWANNHTHIIRGKQPVSTEFLYLRLSELDISGYVTGAAQPKITQANMNRIPVLVSKFALLESFNGKAQVFFSQIKRLEKKNNNLRQTRDLLLPKLISGEIELS